LPLGNDVSGTMTCVIAQFRIVEQTLQNVDEFIHVADLEATSSSHELSRGIRKTEVVGSEDDRQSENRRLHEIVPATIAAAEEQAAPDEGDIRNSI
jgi:hypothetical protein